MGNRSTLVVFSIGFVSLLLIGTLLVSPAIAEYKNTGALNGPVYKWLGQDDVREKYTSGPRGLSNNPQLYFSGGFDSMNSILVRSAHNLVEKEGNGIDSYKDLPEDMKDKLGSPEDIRNNRGGAYEFSKNLLDNNRQIGLIDDWSFKKPPKDVYKWNYLNSISGWSSNMKKGDPRDIALPEQKHFENMAPSEKGKSRLEYKKDPPKRAETNILKMTHKGNTLIALKQAYVLIYANDPSVWTHLHRYKNTNQEKYNKDKLFDRSYKQIGDSGTLRITYTKGFQPKNGIPTKYFDVPRNVVDNSTRWKYTNEDISINKFTVRIYNKTGSTCSTGCNITKYSKVNRVGRRTVNINWDLSKNEEKFSNLGGNKVKFKVNMSIKASYDKRTEYAEVTCDKEASKELAKRVPRIKEGECVNWDTDWYFKDLTKNIVSGQMTVSDSETYVFTNNTGIFESEEDITVRKAKFPDGTYQYAVEINGDIYTGEPTGWNSVKLNENNIAYSQWEYFGSRDKSWDDIYDQHGDEYGSKAMPLRMNAYPKYRYYNYSGSTVDILTPSEADRNISNKYPSPALVGHKSCVQNYGIEFNDPGVGEPTGTYEYHEPCYWNFNASGQKPTNMPINYLQLPHRVSNPGLISIIPGVKDEKLHYNDYVFNKKLSNMIKKDTNKLYTGSYSYMDSVVVSSTKDINKIQINGLVPNSTATEKVSTVEKVSPSILDVQVQPICEEGETGNECEQNPIMSEKYDTYTIEITLKRVLENGETKPINTAERGETLVVYNAVKADGGPLKIDTNEKGKATVKITEPKTSEGTTKHPTIDVNYKPTHWTKTDDPIAPSNVANTKSTIQKSSYWLREMAGILFVIWFMLLGINTFLKKLGKSFNPLKTFTDQFMDSWVKIGIGFVLLFLLLLRPERAYSIILFLIVLYLIYSINNRT